MAEIYGYEVKRLNEQVKRNIARFPEDFMFQLTTEEARCGGCFVYREWTWKKGIFDNNSCK